MGKNRPVQALRRYFGVTVQVPYTDVWTHKPVQFYPGKHPCAAVRVTVPVTDGWPEDAIACTQSAQTEFSGASGDSGA